MMNRLIGEELGSGRARRDVQAVEIMRFLLVYHASPLTLVRHSKYVDRFSQLAELATSTAKFDYKPGWWKRFRWDHA